MQQLLTPKIMVIGDLIIDHYIWGSCDRISPEAPVQVIEVQREEKTLGGACNVAHNLVSLGANVLICGVVGNDEAGNDLCNMLKKLGIETSGIFIENNRPTTKKSRVIASHQQVLRVDREKKEIISTKNNELLLEFIKENISQCDNIILSDYNKGLLSPAISQAIIQLAKTQHKKILVDPKGKDYTKYKGATLLTPNKKEAQEATNIKITDDKSLKQAGFMLKDMCELEISIITLSEDGIGIFEKDMQKIPTIAKEVFDVTGAGDTVIAALSYCLSQGKNIKQAAQFANAAAAVVVGKIGSATATQKEINLYLQRHLESNNANNTLQINILENPRDFTSKIIPRDKIAALVNNMREMDYNINFTNGCFDLLHIGHISYLQEAKKQRIANNKNTNVLIVGLNTDSSIKKLKGHDRPINSQNDRSILLAALECVDFVILFDEETPLELIKSIEPDILIKGADYEGKCVVGSKYAKEVRLITFIPNKSTTNLIAQIQKISQK